MKSVSIKDIASQVGVSTTTVSFVLNGKAKEKRISEDLKNEILKIAEKLNYRPNQVARGLRTGQTHTLGLLIEDISNPFFANLAKVVEEEADRSGYTVMFCSTENNENRASSLLSILKHRQMDGFLITPTPGMEEDIRSLYDDGRPLVLIDRYFPGLNTSYVTVDNFKGSFDGTSYLLSRGCQRVGLITSGSEQVQMQSRFNGYKEAIEGQGKAFDPSLVLKISFEIGHDEAVNKISEFVKTIKPDALFCTTNYLGIYALESIRVNGLSLPADMGMVCFDDHDLFRLGSPAVSVIAQPIAQLGKQAVMLLLEQLQHKGPDQVSSKIILEPSLVRRDT
jgi:LacI family transcriptional regulator